MEFAENLKNIRKRIKLSQQELADKLDVAQSTVGMWESGRRTPKLDELDRMARILKVTVSRLIGKAERDVRVTKNEVYVDGNRVEKLSKKDTARIIEYIQSLTGPKEREDRPPESTRRKRARQKKVLVIDDERDMCELLYSFLIAHNYKVFLTFNAQMGMEYFEEISPDVILLDLQLPDMNGRDVLSIIRKVSDIPVVVITANPQDIADIHLNGLSIEGYIEKPFSLEEVLNTLKHLVGE
ncbi:MAG: response regulator [Candidatus Omnitrophica bacterium]|nr:response regulator [Candidatus Omnitrophota bacterium]